MTFLNIENTGKAIAEIEVQSEDGTSQFYLRPGADLTVREGYLFTLRSAEGGNLGLTLSNTSEHLAHQIFLVSKEATRRQRLLMPDRKRRARVDAEDRLILVPVGAREN